MHAWWPQHSGRLFGLHNLTLSPNIPKASEMAQQGKQLAAKPEDLSLIPDPKQEKFHSSKLSYDSYTCTMTCK